jgi:hypothetical protein
MLWARKFKGSFASLICVLAIHLKLIRQNIQVYGGKFIAFLLVHWLDAPGT